jgi:hypothetical protein
LNRKKNNQKQKKKKQQIKINRKGKRKRKGKEKNEKRNINRNKWQTGPIRLAHTTRRGCAARGSGRPGRCIGIAGDPTTRFVWPPSGVPLEGVCSWATQNAVTHVLFSLSSIYINICLKFKNFSDLSKNQTRKFS